MHVCVLYIQEMMCLATWFIIHPGNDAEGYAKYS